MIFAKETCYIDTTAIVDHEVELGKNLFIGPYVNLYAGEIGDGTTIGAYTEIGGAVVGRACKIQARVFIPRGVTLEDFVFIGPGTIFTNDKYPRSFGTWEIVPTVVRRGAAIGAGAVIAPGVTIGEGAMVGAGAVVCSDVPPFTCVIGNPARVQGPVQDLLGVQEHLKNV